MPRHTSSGAFGFLERGTRTPSSRAFGFLERRQPQAPTPTRPSAPPRSTPFVPSDLLDNFQFDFGNVGPEFRTDLAFPRRLRPPTLEEMNERFGRGLIGQSGAIAAGTGFQRQLRDPFTGQLIDAPSRGSARGRIPFEDVPSFNIEATKVDVGRAQQANSQAFSALRQASARGAIGTFGDRLGARSGGAGLAAINQSAAPLFAAQTSANASLIAGAAFTDQASQQAADVFNVNTRKFGVQSQQDLFSQFRAETGQRADINLKQQSLRLGLEQLKVGKEGQDLQAALEKQRLGISAFNAREQAVMNKFNRWLAEARLQFDIDKQNKSRGSFWGNLFKIAGRAVAAYVTAGASEVVIQGVNAVNPRDPVGGGGFTGGGLFGGGG